MPRLLLYMAGMLSLLVPVFSLAEDTDYIGRLFTTPEQRAEIDAIRYAVEPEPKEVLVIELNEPEARTEPKTAQMPIRLRGMIRGSDGEPVYWINDGNSMQADFLQDNIAVLPGDNSSRKVRIRLPDDRVIPLQIGESYIPGTDTTNSSLSEEDAQLRRP